MEPGYEEIKERGILVVEDYDGLRELLVKELKRFGYNATGVASGREAMVRVEEDPGLILLLDQKLPDMSGRSLVERFKDKGIQVPFIVMTGHGDERLAVEMMKLGASDYLVKSVDLIDLVPPACDRLYRQLEVEKRLRQAEDRIRYMSYHDRLTGLYNRYYLEEEMNRLTSKPYSPFSVIMADLNGLKLVNDTYGYAVGDEMLKITAELLKNACSREEIITRWGSDEFVIFMPGVKAADAFIIIERLRKTQNQVFVQGLPVSFSIGSATVEEENCEPIALLREAEDNMNRHKLTESRSSKNTVLASLLKALEAKSCETEAHTRNMQALALNIGEMINLPDSELQRLNLLITLHDIGKINLPEDVLVKKEPLTENEWVMVKKHPETGYRIALATEQFAHVADDILSHHERWDGKGYPRGIGGKNIPMLARITALADAVEVMQNGRPYKQAMLPEDIISELKKCAGGQFDPQLAEIAVKILNDL